MKRRLVVGVVLVAALTLLYFFLWTPTASKAVIVMKGAVTTMHWQPLRRDCQGESLATLMNSLDWAKYESLATDRLDYDLFSEFMAELTPWAVSEPTGPPFRNAHAGLAERTDCAQPDVSRLFTGRKRSKVPKLIDFVPFGYDIDVLDVHLHELQEVVDLFVVYETTWTQRPHLHKPLYGALLRHRFKHLEHKILWLIGDDADLLPVEMEMSTGHNSWVLENSMRKVPMQKFKKLLPHLPQFQPGAGGEDPLEGALLTENDGDEIWKAEYLMLVKLCELRPNIQFPIDSGSILFKHSFDFGEWLSPGDDTLRGSHMDRSTVDLFKPHLEKGEVIRARRPQAHMPVGASNHLSSFMTPISGAFKEHGGVIEAPEDSHLPKELVAAGKERRITVDTILDNFVFVQCIHTRRWKDTLSQRDTERLYNEVILKTVRENRERYCFLWGREGEEGRDDFMSRAATNLPDIYQRHCHRSIRP
ncbi:hypothetical protein QOT17_020337 [Balamuthia mandrillaris]